MSTGRLVSTAVEAQADVRDQTRIREEPKVKIDQRRHFAPSSPGLACRENSLLD